MNERNTTDGMIRIEADSPAPISQPPATRVPVTPVAPGLAADAVARTGGDDAEDLREEIEETRAELSETLTAIQEKLNPQRLMEQAKDTVQETTDHVIAQATHAAHEAVADAVDHTKEAVVDAMDHTKEAVHDATIGKVEHMVSNVTDAAKNLVGGVTGTTHEETGASYGTGTPIAYSTSVTAPSSGGGGSVWETIKENPIPLALAAASLGWIAAHRAKGSAARPTADTASPPPPAPVAGTVRVTGESVTDKAGQVATQVGSTVGDTADRLQEKAGQVTDQVGGAVGATVSQVQDTAGQVAGQAQQAASGLVQGTQQAASGLVQGTKQQAHQAQSQFQRVLHENPLAVGAAGLALGAVVGLAIPETRRESQVMGGARDHVVDTAIGTAQDTMQKVGVIAQKAESAAEDAAKGEAHTQGLVQ